MEEGGNIEQANMIRSLIEAGYSSLIDISLACSDDEAGVNSNYRIYSHWGTGLDDRFGDIHLIELGYGGGDFLEYDDTGIGTGAGDDNYIRHTAIGDIEYNDDDTVEYNEDEIEFQEYYREVMHHD